MFRLTVSLAGKPVQHFNFDQDSVCVGRDPDCEVSIDNIGISRRHATIERTNGGYVLTDLKSHNGTFVLGRRIYHHPLANTDEFFIGKYTIGFENLDVMAEATKVVDVVSRKSRAVQDMTFQLDRDEIEKLANASTSIRPPKLLQLAPATASPAMTLDRFYYLIGSSARAAIRVAGFRMPPFVAALIRNDKWFHLVALTRKPVLVNGLPAGEHQISDGDVIQIGRAKFRFARS
jgi:hypothetical protein